VFQLPRRALRSLVAGSDRRRVAKRLDWAISSGFKGGQGMHRHGSWNRVWPARMHNRKRWVAAADQGQGRWSRDGRSGTWLPETRWRWPAPAAAAAPACPPRRQRRLARPGQHRGARRLADQGIACLPVATPKRRATLAPRAAQAQGQGAHLPRPCRGSQREDPLAPRPAACAGHSDPADSCADPRSRSGGHCAASSGVVAIGGCAGRWPPTGRRRGRPEVVCGSRLGKVPRRGQAHHRNLGPISARKSAEIGPTTGTTAGMPADRLQAAPGMARIHTATIGPGRVSATGPGRSAGGCRGPVSSQHRIGAWRQHRAERSRPAGAARGCTVRRKPIGSSKRSLIQLRWLYEIPAAHQGQQTVAAAH